MNSIPRLKAEAVAPFQNELSALRDGHLCERGAVRLKDGQKHHAVRRQRLWPRIEVVI